MSRPEWHGGSLEKGRKAQCHGGSLEKARKATCRERWEVAVSGSSIGYRAGQHNPQEGDAPEVGDQSPHPKFTSVHHRSLQADPQEPHRGHERGSARGRTRRPGPKPRSLRPSPVAKRHRQERAEPRPPSRLNPAAISPPLPRSSALASAQAGRLCVRGTRQPGQRGRAAAA